MAIISHSIDQTLIRDQGRFSVSWSALSSADTAEDVEIDGTFTLGGCMQVTGTFGGATVSLEVSNDGANFHALSLVDGSAAPTLTSAGVIEFSTGARFIRPAAAGGTSDSLNVTIFGRS